MNFPNFPVPKGLRYTIKADLEVPFGHTWKGLSLSETNSENNS